MATNLAAQLYTIRQHMQTPQDMDESLRKISKQGWKAVQFSGQGPIDFEDLRRLADKHELKAAATHNSWDDLTEHTKRVIKQHKALGCKYVGLGSMPEAFRQSAEGFTRFAEEASDVAKALADEGLRFIYHNHNFEFIRFGEVTGMDILLEKAAPEVQFELDTYWVQAGGGDVRTWIKRCVGRIDVIHLKDMAFDPALAQVTYAEIGRGNLDWKRILRTCKKAGVRWYIVEQDECPADPFDSLKISLDYLKNQGMK